MSSSKATDANAFWPNGVRLAISIALMKAFAAYAI